MHGIFRKKAQGFLVLLLGAGFTLAACASSTPAPDEFPDPPETTAPVYQEQAPEKISYVEEYGYLLCGPEQVFPGPEALVSGADTPLYLTAWTEAGEPEWAVTLSREAYLNALSQASWRAFTKDMAEPIQGDYLTLQCGTTVMTLPQGGNTLCISSPLGEFWFTQEGLSLTRELGEEGQEVPVTLRAAYPWSGDWAAAAEGALEAYAAALAGTTWLEDMTITQAGVDSVTLLQEGIGRAYVQFRIQYRTDGPVDENRLAGNARVLEDGAIAQDLVAGFVLDGCGVCHLVSLGTGL